MGLNTEIPGLSNGYGNVFTLFFNHGNNVPADNLEYYFGWRIGLGPETTDQFNNRIIAPQIKCVVRGVQISWRIANTPSLEIVPFYLSVWDERGYFKTKIKVAESPLFLIAVGATSGYVANQLEDVHLCPNDQLMMSYKQTWATNPSNLLVSGNLFCERVIA